MNTHPHSDHTGGLPALVAEGATIITQKNNEEFLDRALNTPRTLLNDTLAKNPKKAKIRNRCGEEGLLGRNANRGDVPHRSGSSLQRLDDRIYSQGEGPVPGRLLGESGEPANDHVKALVPVLEKLNLDFNRYINVHTSAAPQYKADVWKAMGK